MICNTKRGYVDNIEYCNNFNKQNDDGDNGKLSYNSGRHSEIAMTNRSLLSTNTGNRK